MSLPKGNPEAHFRLHGGVSDLRNQSSLVSAYGLAARRHKAKAIRVVKMESHWTDGVFPESKESSLAFWMVDVESPNRAYEIAGEVL